VGSNFCAELELKVLDKSDVITLKTEVPINGYQGERKKILIVDDNTTNISILHQFLKNLGFIMQTSKNGEEAVLSTMAFHPDLIRIDLIMPVMDGIEAVKIIRSKEQIANIKIIGLSASLTEPNQKNNFISLCNSFINKPVDFGLLLNEIQKLLALEWLSLKLDYTENLPEKSLHYTEIPNKKTLHELLRLLKIGNFHKIEALTNSLVKEDELLGTFCKTVQKYCQTFDDEKLTKFIQQFI
jgi:CheY-like chemotaxis protein